MLGKGEPHHRGSSFSFQIFELLELELNHPVKVVVCVSGPEKMSGISKTAKGMPIVYLVREATSVSILSIKKLTGDRVMENSQRVNEAIEQVFAKLLSMTQEERDARLAKRQMGPIGRVFRE